MKVELLVITTRMLSKLLKVFQKKDGHSHAHMDHVSEKDKHRKIVMESESAMVENEWKRHSGNG